MGQNDNLAEPSSAAEALFFERFAGSDVDPGGVFVIGSPRTGSTLTYQLLVQAFEVSYISNFTAQFYPREPVVGIALEQQLGVGTPRATRSSYGKTEGPHSLSEASAVFAHWFGGGHPSEIKSARIKDGKEGHLRSTFAAVEGLTGNTLLTKNSWNCFRIPAIRRLLPQSFFVWIRRDLVQAARSDLSSRYRHGGPHIWNSASPANYEEIRKLPYWQQVVEQQFEYNRVVGEDLAEHASGYHLEVWYEDLCADPESQLARLDERLAAAGLGIGRRDGSLPDLAASRGRDPDEDARKIDEHVARHEERLRPYRHRPDG